MHSGSLLAQFRALVSEDEEVVILDDSLDEVKKAPTTTATDSVETFSLRYDELRRTKKIAMGGEATVYLGTYHEQSVAIKVFDIQGFVANPLEHAKNEVALLARFASPHIVKSYGYAFSDKQAPCVVLEYMKQGSLHDVLRKKRLTEEQRIKMASQIARALLAIHVQGYVYNDLKAENVLCDDDYNAKLTDFGLTRHSDVMQDNGTPGYMAPEVFLQRKTTQMSDVYSFGVLLLQIISNNDSAFSKAIMSNCEPYEIYNATIDGSLNDNMMKLLKNFKTNWKYPLFIINMIEHCLHVDPTKRPTMNLLVDSFDAYFKSLPRQIITGDIVQPTEEKMQLCRIF